jgi:hypothetical protein
VVDRVHSDSGGKSGADSGRHFLTSRPRL